MPPEPPVVSPRTLDEAYAVLATLPHRPLAGGTDLLVQLNGELGEPPERVMNLWGIEAMRGIRGDDHVLVVGALSTYTDLRRSPEIAEHLPVLAAAAATIGAAQIQNRGTIGGNAANASPAGDTLPILLATDAELLLGSQRGERTVPAAAFWTGYRQTALAQDELIVSVRFPLRPGRQVRFRKVGTRRAQAISKVVMALAWEPDDQGLWRNVHLALGSMAPTPVRAPATEAVLEGFGATQETADRAAAVLAGELAPIDDVRSSADYRRTVASRVLHRLIRDEGGW